MEQWGALSQSRGLGPLIFANQELLRNACIQNNFHKIS